jgi:hypothetical protein
MSSVAPCGINCSVCYCFLREKNNCKGCCGPDDKKPKHCVQCSIKNCALLAETRSMFCMGCEIYPCKRLKQLDKRYREKYKTSILGNLEFIRTEGLQTFIGKENEKWTCLQCGGVICMHKRSCTKCGLVM